MKRKVFMVVLLVISLIYILPSKGNALMNDWAYNESPTKGSMEVDTDQELVSLAHSLGMHTKTYLTYSQSSTYSFMI